MLLPYWKYIDTDLDIDICIDIEMYRCKHIDMMG